VRIVCWNQRGGTDAKWDRLLDLRPDVAVLPESARAPRRLAASLLDDPPDWHWVGTNPAKGLAVAMFAGTGAAGLAGAGGSRGSAGFSGTSAVASGVVVPDATGRWSVAARRGNLTVLGVWSCPSDGQYSREVVRAVQAHSRWLDPRAEVVVAGDFNVDAAGARRRRSPAFHRVHEQLVSLGLTSAYHAVRSEPFGAETWPTYYHHRDQTQPFHIDFCYLSAPLLERATTVEVGGYDQWIASGLSDHAPVIVDLAD
jgi:hypothetical protein